MSSEIFLTNAGFASAIDHICDAVNQLDFVPDIIVTFPRGGLVPATYVSHRLNCPIEIVASSKYDFKKSLSITPEQKELFSRSNVLIVDDIVDTGDTVLEFIRDSGVKSYMVAALAVNEAFDLQVLNYMIAYYTTKQAHQFMVFPWEVVSSDDD